ncbi:PAS domain S-box protein [Aquibacillus sediminis]|uniref:PAS domain S-box protein n=1 Tax=Aquibacillus sediminis TaxID=2574734 RepID=UPI0011080452|nr:PAS domain S-box protein [Aquibacillus sediminis]
MKNFFQQVFSTNQSDKLLDLILNEISDFIYVMDVTNDEFYYYYINQVGQEHLDMTDWQGKSLDQLMPTELAATIKGHYQQVIQTKCSVTYEDKVWKDGVWMYGHNIVTPLFNDQQEVDKILCVTRDITDRKMREDDLKRTNELYQSLLQNSGDAILILSKQKKILEVNPAFETLYGWTEQELQQLELPFVPAEQKEEVDYLLNRVLCEEATPTYQCKRMRKNGEVIDVSVSLSPIHNAAGEVVAISSMIRDITKQKQEEMLLEDGKARHSSLFEFNPFPMIRIDLNGLINKVNPACEEKFSYSKHQFKQMSLLELVADDEIEHARTNIQQIVQGNQTKFQTKLVKQDGESLVCELTASPIVVKETIVGFHCIIDDKTEKLAMLQAMQKSEENYRLITDHSLDLITVHDANGMITYASPSHASLLGKADKDFIHQLLTYEVHEDDQKQYKTAFYQSLISLQDFTVNIRKWSIDGWVWYQAKGTPVAKDNGEISHVVIVARDISKQVKYQQRLQEMAYVDHLTQLPNRRLFEDRFSKLLAFSKRKQKKFAVLYLDGDNFKEINDKWGHDFGDKYLQMMAQRLSSNVREEDTVARLGGDEFALLLTDMDKADEVTDVANKLRELLAKPCVIDEVELQSTFSIGFSIFPIDGTTGDTLMRNADQSLYLAKEYGKNNVHAYEQVVGIK